MSVLKISDYIDLFFHNNKSEFARSMNVTPQQVTKWVNGGWVISGGKIYSPKRERTMTTLKEEIFYLANVFCGAQYSLAEKRNLLISGEESNKKAKRATDVIKVLSGLFIEHGYTIRMVGYNKETSKHQFYDNQDLFELGETYFGTPYPGCIAFMFKDREIKDLSFTINYESPRFISGRFSTQSYRYLFDEIRAAMSAI